MTRKARMIRKYQTSFGMTRKEAEVYYSQINEQDQAQVKTKARTYYSGELKNRVTVPE